MFPPTCKTEILTSYCKQGDGPVLGPQDVKIDKQSFDESDAMMEQAKAFLNSVARGCPPLVSGHTAMEAFETATIISDLVGGQAAV